MLEVRQTRAPLLSVSRQEKAGRNKVTFTSLVIPTAELRLETFSHKHFYLSMRPLDTLASQTCGLSAPLLYNQMQGDSHGGFSGKLLNSDGLQVLLATP